MSPHFLVQNGRPLILGHRGASADFPENTLLAFRQAMLGGADGVELDVMRCGSGEVVVIHDDDLIRVTGGAEGSGAAVRRTPLGRLRAFDLGRGERIPTLAEVLEELGTGALINVELKSREARGGRDHLDLLHDDGLAQATAAVLGRAGRLSGAGPAAGNTLVSSFDPLQLVRFRRHSAGAAPIGYLFHKDLVRPLREAWPASVLRPEAVHPEAALVDAVNMRRWRRSGYAVHVWTVDDPREVAALRALSVDAIITNTPAAVRKLVEG